MDERSRSRTEHGVRDLIRRLEEEGLAAGRQQADRLLAAAEQRAAQIVDQAGRQAASLREAAQRDAQAQVAAAREALRLACRDALHVLKEELGELFGRRLRTHVAAALAEEGLLASLLTTMTRAMAGETARTALAVRLADSGLERAMAVELPIEDLDRLSAQLLRELLAEGCRLGTLRGGATGLRLALQGQDIEVDLGDESLTALLLQFLSPRVRALLDGLPGAG